MLLVKQTLCAGILSTCQIKKYHTRTKSCKKYKHPVVGYRIFIMKLSVIYVRILRHFRELILVRLRQAGIVHHGAAPLCSSIKSVHPPFHPYCLCLFQYMSPLVYIFITDICFCTPEWPRSSWRPRSFRHISIPPAHRSCESLY